MSRSSLDIGGRGRDVRARENRPSIFHRLLYVVRYRFLLFAGIFPYMLGSAVAFHSTGTFHRFYFWEGFVAIALVLVGVEVLNEHFDYKIGGDRIFLNSERKVTSHYLRVGIITFTLAFLIALHLSITRGWPIMIFAALGASAALFYVGPPIRWSYRGLGEVMIFLAYGPFMTVGSYYLQTQAVDFAPAIASLIPGCLVLALALVNEVPDYYGDRLVGKRNVVVRMGRKKTVTLYKVILFTSFAIVAIGSALGRLPVAALLIFLALPLAFKNASHAGSHYDHPESFIPAIRGTIFLYVSVLSLFTITYSI